MKFENKGKWVRQINESSQSNVPDKLKYFVYTKDKLKTKEDFEKALKEMKKAYYEEPSGFEKNLIDQEMAIVKTWQKQKFESSQINESRNYYVEVKISVPDNMNNRDVEDRLEEILDDRGFTVLDITATRK